MFVPYYSLHMYSLLQYIWVTIWQMSRKEYNISCTVSNEDCRWNAEHTVFPDWAFVTFFRHSSILSSLDSRLLHLNVWNNNAPIRAILCHCIWMPGIIEQSINHVAVPTQSCCNTSVRLEKDLLIWVYISRYIFFHSDKSPSNRWTLVKYLAISFAYSVDTRVVGLNLGPNGIRFGEGAAAKNCTLRWKGRNPKSC